MEARVGARRKGTSIKTTGAGGEIRVFTLQNNREKLGKVSKEAGSQ
jgi:hypothetical protein